MGLIHDIKLITRYRAGKIQLEYLEGLTFLKAMFSELKDLDNKTFNQELTRLIITVLVGIALIIILCLL